MSAASIKGQSNGSLCDVFSLVCILINQHLISPALFENEQLLSAYYDIISRKRDSKRPKKAIKL